MDVFAIAPAATTTAGGSTFVAHASTCTGATDFDTAITVYGVTANDETPCSNLVCLDGRDDDTECDIIAGEGATTTSSSRPHFTTVAWQATADTSYYILVHGSEANHTGNFGLSVSLTESLLPTYNQGPPSATNHWVVQYICWISSWLWILSIVAMEALF